MARFDDGDDVSASLRTLRAERSSAAVAEVAAAAGIRSLAAERLAAAPDDEAAVAIQAAFRGHRDRGVYTDELRRRFDADEEERERIRTAQVSAGEVLMRT